jgi:hypothetical protein
MGALTLTLSSSVSRYDLFHLYFAKIVHTHTLNTYAWKRVVNKLTLHELLAHRSSIVPVGISAVGPGEYAGAHTAACETQIDSRKVNRLIPLSTPLILPLYDLILQFPRAISY